MTNTKRILALALGVMMILSLLPTNFVFAADGDITYLYCDENGANWQTGTKTSSEYALVTTDDNAWGTANTATWYYASGNITISNRVTVNGDVHLILADDCNLTVSGGIAVNSGNKFTIYAQNDGMGILTSRSNTSGAGIGSNGDTTGGDITINGGFINASAPAYYGDPAGIGGGSYAVCGIVTVNGGTVNASGCGKGIGCGAGKTGGKIIFNGGFIIAGGIGSGSYGESVETNVNEKAVVINSGKLNTSKESEWKGIVFKGNNGKIYGTNAAPNENFEIPNGRTLTITSGQTLTIDEGVTLTNNSTIVIEEGGQLIVEGTLINSGEITNNGTLGGTGDVKNKVTISFNAGEGSGTMESVTAYTTDTYTLPTNSFTAPNGYEFKAWRVGDIEKSAEETITITENTTVTAVWKALAATVPTISAVSADLTDDNALTYGKITAEDKLTVTATVDSGAEYNLTYQWYKASSASSKDGATDITGATEASYAIPTNTAAGDYYYYCTVTATRKDNGEIAKAETEIISVTVNKLPVNITWNMPQSLVFDGSEKTITAELANKVGNDSVNLTIEGTVVATNKGEYTATVTAIDNGNYTLINGENLTKEFVISEKELNADNITDIAEVTYTGEEIEPVIEVKDGGTVLVLDTDYEVTYQDNTNAGTAKAVITYKGNYKGTAEKEFTILPKTINTEIPLTAPASNAAPQTTIDTDEYTATVVWSPEVTDKFAYSTAYAATITITPKANYTVTGISENSYTVIGAEIVTNEADSGNVTVTYAETGRRPSVSNSVSGTYCTVKFEVNGGSTIADKTVTRNSTISEPTEPAKDGYTFDGWYTDKKFTTAYDFATKVTKNFTIYAKWSENEVDNTDDKKDETDDKTDTPDTPVWENPFTDVGTSDWYYKDVEYAAENGLMGGTTTTTFAPDGIITRAMLVTVLYRNEGEPAVGNDLRVVPFGDVADGMYYTNAVIWAKQNGIVNGVSETEFAPDQNIIREQIAAIMHRYAQYKGYDVSAGENTNILSYDDFDSISEYAVISMQYAVGSGLMKGKTESTLNPLDNAARAEIAAILHRFIEADK